jgi:hypothetical protein
MKLSNQASGPFKSAQISAVVLNADGTVKRDLGVVAYWHRNPFKRWAWAIRAWIKRTF